MGEGNCYKKKQNNQGPFPQLDVRAFWVTLSQKLDRLNQMHGIITERGKLQGVEPPVVQLNGRQRVF